MLTSHSWDAGPDMLDDTLETQPSVLQVSLLSQVTVDIVVREGRFWAQREPEPRGSNLYNFRMYRII